MSIESRLSKLEFELFRAESPPDDIVLIAVYADAATGEAHVDASAPEVVTALPGGGTMTVRGLRVGRHACG
jgi:quinol monooxygenase YgiN